MSPSELACFLNELLTQKMRMSVMIWGPPGIGKSSIVATLAAQHGLACVDVRLSQLAPTDLRGLPVPEGGCTRWMPPEFLPREGRGILFLDEINMARPAMQGVAQQLILDRRVGSYVLPDEWYVWAAGNRKQDKAAAYDMPAPLANRFIHLEVEPDSDDFRRYALRQGLHEAILGFLAFRPDLLHKFDGKSLAWPSPRSWVLAERLHSVGLSVEPAVGLAAAVEFNAFLTLREQLPDLDAILSGSKLPDFPEEISLRYAAVMGLVARCADAGSAVNGLRWLVHRSSAEWAQLYASDLFPRLRERGLMEDAQGQIFADERLRGFLTDYARLLAG